MQYRTLGCTGVQVSRLCLGTMSFGGDADEAASAAMYRRARDAGINFVDTADVYGRGRAEEILAGLIAGERDELVIASKVHFPMGPGVNDRGLSRRHIQLGVEGSLRRLGTDRLDLYFVHGFDELTPMDETLRALDDLVHAGKILYPAASNWAAWQIAKALGISAVEGLAAFACVQPMYSLVKRQAEVEILPMAQAEGVGVISYSPLASGMLTGKYGGGGRPEVGRLLVNQVHILRYANPTYLQVADRFVAHARARGVDPASLAVSWVMSHPAITAPIIGARNVEQMEASLGALAIEMTPDWRDEISALSPEPPTATDRSEEKSGIFYQGTER
jgi:aryl-alcohol dehydrogenase-like predicted oxidoreductase